MKKNIFIILFFLISGSVSICISQVNLEWFRTFYDGYSPCLINDMAVNSLGNAYVVGDVSESGNSSVSAFGTVKFNANGDLVWSDMYKGSLNRLSYAKAVTVDKYNNVYVTGTSQDIDSSENCCTIKFNSSGERIWIRKYQEAPFSRDFGIDICLDNDDNVYVLGNTYYNHVNTIKYDSSGNLLWVSYFDENLSVSKTASSITVDTNKNVYITGTVYNISNRSDFFTVKYDQYGHQKWASFFNFANLNDLPCDIKLDKNRNVYILGRSMENDYNEFYTTVVKYDNNGNQIWSFITDSIGFHGSNYYALKMSLGIDAVGNSYIGTTCKNNCSLLKLSPDGFLLWNSKFNGQPEYISAIGRAVYIDNEGFIYVNGTVTKFLGSNDFCTLKYNSSGTLLWFRSFHSAILSDDISSFISVSNSGNVYVSGIGYNSNEGVTKFCVVKYSQSVGINSITSEIPDNYELYQNYPNPFNPKTIMTYEIPLNNLVTLKVYDIQGKEKISIVNENQNAGKYEADFDGSDLASGVYYYKLSAGNFSQTKRMILLK